MTSIISKSLTERARDAAAEASAKYAAHVAGRTAERRQELLGGASELTREVLGLELDGGYTIVSDEVLTFEYDGLSFRFLQDADEPWNQALFLVRKCVNPGCLAGDIEEGVRSLEQLGDILSDAACHSWDCRASKEAPPPTRQTRNTLPTIEQRLFDTIREVVQIVAAEGA